MEGIPRPAHYWPLVIPAFPGYYKPGRLEASGQPAASLYWGFEDKVPAGHKGTGARELTGVEQGKNWYVNSKSV